jgi:cytochrome b involved in lipid metabolism
VRIERYCAPRKRKHVVVARRQSRLCAKQIDPEKLSENIMKRLLSSVLVLAVGAAAHAQTSSFTLADVAQHATAKNCWMVLNSNKVYDFSPFVTLHPGGNAMVPFCGKDGTQAFNSPPHPHSAFAASLEATYFIGNLVTAPAAISVTIAPANASVNTGATAQFTPTVTNSSQGVAWTVLPSTLGTISASGLFTGVTPGQGTVTAASMQDSTKTASAVVTVNAVPPPGGGGGSGGGAITLSIAPSAVTASAGSRVRFRAALGNSTQGVTWTASASIGTIDKSGRLTAAMTPGTGTVTATSVQDPTKTASAQVTLTPVSCRPGDDSAPTKGRSDD